MGRLLVNVQRMAAIVPVLIGGSYSGCASGHSGGLNAQGCHNDRKNGGYHCHRGSSNERAQQPRQFTGATFANCSAARAAGAAPVRHGDPGYGPRLDRDGDGVGCE